ncbi:MAG: terminase [Pseudomonadota bacterium]
MTLPPNERARQVKRAEAYLRAHAKGRLTDKADLMAALSLKWFRLNSLYKIKDKDGKVRRFRPNKAQRERYLRGHCLDLILKARQLGFTTFEMIDSLDDCLFKDNFASGCICHKLEDAQDIFRNKITFAYENIDDAWHSLLKMLGTRIPRPVSDKSGSGAYVFDNGSSIRVSTSYRGGTLQRLHVSEFGKICRQYPHKAKEIVTGAFEAVGVGNQITLESTAEGREGYFFDYSQQAQQHQEQGKALTDLDFQFHFFPWWQEPTYTMAPENVVVPQRLREYFEQLEQKHGIPTTAGQQAWYAKKAEKLQDDMQREYPSTPEEAFAQSVDGAYFATQMQFLRKNGRLTKEVQVNPSLPVYTGWDLGMNDTMAIWFVQIIGREVHLVDYLEGEGEGIEYYADLLNKKGYRYGGHFGPHDLAVRELGTGKSRADVAKQFGIKFEIVPRISNHAEGVQATRNFLPMCWINEEDCHQGVLCLDNYRKEWDDKRGVYKDTPRHDWASHGAKALETIARSDLFQRTANAVQRSESRARGGWAAHT